MRLAEPGTQLINTSVPKKEVPANNEASKEVEEEETHDALGHLADGVGLLKLRLCTLHLGEGRPDVVPGAVVDVAKERAVETRQTS